MVTSPTAAPATPLRQRMQQTLQSMSYRQCVLRPTLVTPTVWCLMCSEFFIPR